MARVNKRIRRQSLHGWWKWAPLVFLVFSMLFFDCWLSTERRLQDFELSRLRKEADAARKDIEKFEAQSAELETLDRLEDMAGLMGLQLPAPGQIERIYYDPVRDVVVPFAYPFSVPRLDEASQASAAVQTPAAVTPAAAIGEGLPEAAVWD